MCFAGRRGGLASGAVQTFAYGATLHLRRFYSHPLITLSILASLALGIGVTTAAFSFVNDLLLAPPTSFASPERLLEIGTLPPKGAGGASRLPLSYFEYRALSKTQAFSEVAATQVVRVLYEQDGNAERIDGEMVTSDYFRLAKTPMALGRAFGPEEDGAPGQAPVAILSQEFWQDRLGGRPDLLGSKIRLNGYTFSVIGVAARGFRGMNRFNPPDFWVPLSMYRQIFLLPDLLEKRDGRILRIFGRLRPGVGPSQAQAEVRRIGYLLALEDGAEAPRLAAWPLGSGSQSEFLKRLETGSRAALGATFVFLLIACVNVTNLMLVQARGRTKENALQLALGASRGRLVRRELGEGLLLTGAGGVLGLLVALATRHSLWRLRPSYLDERVVGPVLNSRVLAFVFLVTLFTALLCSIAPVLRSWRTDLLPLIRQEGFARAQSGPFSWITEQLLVVVQVCLSAASLGLAALFLSSLWHNLAIDPGFETRHMALASFDLQLDGYDPPRVRSIQEQVAARLKALPQVESVALAENRLLGGFRLWRTLNRRGVAQSSGPLQAGSSAVGENYFETVSIPRLQGRAFTLGDTSGSQVLILNEVLANRLFPLGDAIGQQVVLDQETTPYEVVGVVSNSSYLVAGEDPLPFLYLPLARNPGSRFTLHVRTLGDPEAILPLMRRAIHEVAPSLPIEELGTMENSLRQSQWMPRMSAWLLSLLGGLAVVLAGVGVYGVAASSAQRRRGEIGVRIVLGAQRATIIRSILARGLTAVLFGLVCGLILMLWLARWVQNILYNAGELGWGPALVVISILFLKGFLANLAPALQVARHDISRVLREN